MELGMLLIFFERQMLCEQPKGDVNVVEGAKTVDSRFL